MTDVVGGGGGEYEQACTVRDSVTSIANRFIQKRRQRSSLLFGGTDCIEFLAALAVLHQDNIKKRMNCTRMI